MANVKVRVRNGNNESTNETMDINMVIRNKRFGNRTATDLSRKRPRNKNEERTLRRWEAERGGVKIGTI